MDILNVHLSMSRMCTYFLYYMICLSINDHGVNIFVLMEWRRRENGLEPEFGF